MQLEELGRKMVVFRAKKDISQKQLAKMCLLSHQTINSIELGVRNPTRLTEQKILNVIEKGE